MAASPQPPAWTFTMLSNDKLPLLHPQLPLQKNHHCDRSPPSLSARSAAGLSTGSCWKHCVAKHLDILTMFQCWTCNRQHRMFLGLASSSTWPGANPPAAEVLNIDLIIEPVSDVIHEENLWAKCPQQPGLPPTGCLLQLSQGRHREEAPKIKHLYTLNQRCNWHCYQSRWPIVISPSAHLARIATPCVEDPVFQVSLNSWSIFHFLFSSIDIKVLLKEQALKWIMEPVCLLGSQFRLWVEATSQHLNVWDLLRKIYHKLKTSKLISAT